MSANLLALPLTKSPPDFYLGLEGAGNLPRRYTGIDIVDPLDFGADPTGGSDSTDAFQAAVSEAFGVAVFKAGTGGVSSDTLTVTSMIAGTINPGKYLRRDGALIAVPPSILAYGTASTTGTGGTGTYKLSAAVTIPNGTTCVVSNSRQGSWMNKRLVVSTGNYLCSRPIYIIDCVGGMVESVYGVRLAGGMDGTEGNPFSADSSLTPQFYIDGGENISLKNLGLEISALSQVNLWATNTTATGNSTLHTTDTSLIKLGMKVHNFDHPATTGVNGLTVTGVGSGTVTVSPAVLAGTVAVDDTLIFVTSTGAVAITNSGWFGETKYPYFRDITMSGGSINLNVNFGGGANTVMGGMVYNCLPWYGCVSGIRLNAGARTWNVFGGAPFNCGRASTFDPVYKKQRGNYGGGCCALPGSSFGWLSNLSLDLNNFDVVDAGGSCNIMGARGEGQGTMPLYCEFTGHLSSGQMVVESVQHGKITLGGAITDNIDYGSSAYRQIVSFVSGTNGGAGTYGVVGDTASGTNDFAGVTTSSRAWFQTGKQNNAAFASVDGVTISNSHSVVGGNYDTDGKGENVSCSLNGMFFLSNCSLKKGEASYDGSIIDFGDNGVCVLDSYLIDFKNEKGLWVGGTGARMFMRDGFWLVNRNANLWTNFTGRVLEMNDWIDRDTLHLGDGFSPPFSVASLPAPAACFKHVKCFVYDSNLAAVKANYGTNISGHGGGTNTVRVGCPSGSAWVIVSQ